MTRYARNFLGHGHLWLCVCKQVATLSLVDFPDVLYLYHAPEMCQCLPAIEIVLSFVVTVILKLSTFIIKK